MDLGTFIIAVFRLIDDRIEDQRRLRRGRGPVPELSLTRRFSPSRSSASFWDSTKTRNSSRTSGATTPTSSSRARRRVHRTTFTPGRRPTSVEGQGEASARTPGRNPSRPEVRFGGFLPPAGVPLRSRPQVPALSRRGRFGQGRPPRTDLLYGFRARVRVYRPGVITRFCVAPADAHELSVLPELVEHTSGVVVGDRNYYRSSQTEQELAGWGVELAAPYRNKKRDPHPQRGAFSSSLRYRIDTVFPQLVGRYSMKRVWARGLWHLSGRLLRKVLSHTLALLLNRRLGNQPLQLSRLLS